MPSFRSFGGSVASPGNHPAKRRTTFRSKRAVAAPVTRVFSQDALSSLPATNADLTTPFSQLDYGNVSAVDQVRVATTGSSYILHQFKQRGTSNTLGITCSWTGQASTAASSAAVYLQIYNQSSGLWETLASNSTSAADTDFTLSGSQPTNLANYYDSSLFRFISRLPAADSRFGRIYH
jgi:hypothetical protein